MIEGLCRTNLDEAKQHRWPTKFVAVPQPGEMVQALSDGPWSLMEVCRVTHRQGKDGGPYIEVELTTKFLPRRQ